MISLLIPTFSRSALLLRTLETVLDQDLPRDEFEVVIIDNASSDDTREVSERFIQEHPKLNVRYVFEARMGLVFSRNRGAVEARGDVLAYTDEDVRLSPEYLRAIRDLFEDPEVHIAEGRSIPDFETEPPDWFEELWTPRGQGGYNGVFSILDLGDNVCEMAPDLCFGVNMSTRRETLIRLGGTHPDSSPKKYELYQGDGEIGYAMKVVKAGHKCMYNPGATLYHLVSKGRMQLEYVRRRMYYQGISDSFHYIRQHEGSLDEAFIRKIEAQLEADALPPRSSNPARKAFTAAKLLLQSPRQFTQHCQALLGQGGAPPSEEASPKLSAIMRSEHRSGYWAHQKTVRDNPDMLDWILREEFIEGEFSDLVNHDADVESRSY